MGMHPPFSTVAVDPAALDVMMPMHALVSGAGVILHAGPTLEKVGRAGRLAGRPFFELFAPRRPQSEDLAEICRKAGAKFYLRLRDPDRTPMIATAVPLDRGQGVLVNLSFGIAVIDAVARFNLTGSDFAATDLALEMLYLVEAKSAAMEESRKLNQRLHGAKAAAEAEAMADALTGLRNRRALDQMLHRLISRGIPFTLMNLDLDFFKQVNDTLGHAAGDKVLIEVARILLEETRGDDVVARVGGDEFVLVFNGLTDVKRLEAIATRLIHRLEEPILYDERQARISASIGLVSSSRYAHPDSGQMQHDADLALYASKNAGRARFTLFTPELGEGPEPAAKA